MSRSELEKVDIDASIPLPDGMPESLAAPKSAEQIHPLPPATKYAFANLCSNLLALEFGGDSLKRFRHDVVAKVCKVLEIGTKSANALIATSDDADLGWTQLPNLIEKLRADDVCKKNGLSVLPKMLVSIFVAGGAYDSRVRILIRHVTAFLAVEWDEIEAFENTLVDTLNDAGKEETEEQATARKRQERNKKIKRYAMIGSFGTIGGVLIGLTGGLAAPLFAAGAGVFLGGAAAAGIATTAGAAIIGSLFGVAGAGLAGYKMKRRVGGLTEFIIEPMSGGKAMHCVLAVSGWITDDRPDAFSWAWRHMALAREQYCLRYETKEMVALGNAVSYLQSFAISYAIQQTLMETALAGLVSAVAWPAAILSIGSVVDNPWNVCVNRAEEAGRHLAHLLLTRQHGHRPITLIGFSLGARVIYTALRELSKHPAQEVCGVVEDVILLGAPVTGSISEWKQILELVAGRVINGYSKSDWVLSYLYRTMNAQYRIAGTAPIEVDSPRIVNINLTEVVAGHLDYHYKMTDVLKAVGIHAKPSEEGLVEAIPFGSSESSKSEIAESEREQEREANMGNAKKKDEAVEAVDESALTPASMSRSGTFPNSNSNVELAREATETLTLSEPLKSEES